MKRWVIGLDLQSDARGPLHLGAWLHRATGASLFVVHVAHAPSVQGWARDDLRAGLEALLRAELEAGAVAPLVAHTEVVFAASADRGLAEQTRAREAGLLIGRRARSGPVGIVRLGRVARRVLRRLPGVVGVAAPDLAPDDLASGPVVLALDASPDIDGAAAFARALATSLDRELVLAHAWDLGGEALARSLSGPESERFQRALRGRAETVLLETIAREGLSDRRCITADGPPADTVLSIAEDVRACAIVCGSRRLSLTERVFGGSSSSTLAGVARMPVFIAPPDLATAG